VVKKNAPATSGSDPIDTSALAAQADLPGIARYLASMKTAAVVLALVLSSPLHAERFIVPVYAHIVHGSDGAFGSSLQVTNLESLDVTVRIAEMYQAERMAACDAEVEVTIPARETRWLYPPDGCRGIFALVLESSGPVLIHSEISTVRNFTSWHTQHVPLVTDWLPSARDAILPVVRIDLPSSPDPVGPFRSNLFVVNPNDEALHFELHVERRSQSAPSRKESHVIAPRSVAVLRLEGVSERWCDPPPGTQALTVAPNCSPTYDLTVRADRPFYASVSTVAHGGDARITPPALLEP
jgi:hypothetical protein